MKDVSSKLLGKFREGYCTPQISQLSRVLHEPTSTVHYNIKKLETEKKIRGYRAILDHSKLDEGFTAFVLIRLASDEYGDPERIARDLAKRSEVESVDIITGDWEVIVKVRVKDQEGYYHFVRTVISRKGIERVTTLTSLKQLKSEFLTNPDQRQTSTK